MPRKPDERTPIPTVATRLQVPPAPEHLIPRRRLLDALDRGVAEHLVLLSAPAGAGKTVLLASWARTRRPPGPVCWLTLDADHNDASRLIADLLSALRSSGAIPPGSALARLSPPPGGHTERFLPLLVNGLAELSSPVVLVLDEIHELASPAATDTIDFLVRHAPHHTFRLLLAGRADPPLPIERLRMSEALAELRIADLAFDRSETAELCKRLELVLSEADVEVLWGRTEGWAAALRLAALSLRGHPDPARFLAEFAGTDRTVADYLVAEVLARVPEERREFMLRTCLVDLLSPELADALTDSHAATDTLASLEHSGAPMQPAADVEHTAEPWYRYHPLFRELLRAHLHHAHREEVPLLHRRAAGWYGEHGQTMPAIRHALAGGDWERAGGLIAENWLELFLHGGSAAMRGPMTQLPAEIVAADPRLAAAVAGSRLQDGDLPAAERHLAIARRARGAGTAEGASAAQSASTAQSTGSTRAHGRLELTLTAVALYHARLRSRVKDTERLARKLAALAHTGPRGEWTALRSFALSQQGAVRLWCSEPAAAAPELHEALALATEGGHAQIVLDCLAQLAVVDLLAGRLTAAQERSGRAVEAAEHGGWGEGPAVACAYLACATVAYRRGEFERAEGLLTHAAEAADTAEAPVRLAASVMHGLALAAAGPRSAARGALKLRAVRAAIAEGDLPVLPEFLAVGLEDAEARVLIAAGELEQAREALESARTVLPGRGALLVRQAALELSAEQPEAAAAALGEALAGHHAAETGGVAGLPFAALIEAWLLQAVLEHAGGERRAAAEALDRALALAEREPYRDAFLLTGPTVGELLEHQAQLGTAHPALLEVLLDGLGQRQPLRGATLAEPLTEREQRILRYLPTMLSNAEIGAEMFVSLNTVKTHLRSIYRKLDANGRADAVERARRLGLLPSGIKRPRVLQRM